MKITASSYLAEYLGAFFFVLVIIVSGGNPLVIGAALALCIFLVGSVSGGHLNPAVSLAMHLNGSLKHIELFGYMFAQLLGAVSAYYAYKLTK